MRVWSFRNNAFFSSLQELLLKPGEQSELTILFDSTYCKDKNSRSEAKEMKVSYKEHPQTVRSHMSDSQAVDFFFHCLPNRIASC